MVVTTVSNTEIFPLEDSKIIFFTKVVIGTTQTTLRECLFGNLTLPLAKGDTVTATPESRYITILFLLFSTYILQCWRILSG